MEFRIENGELKGWTYGEDVTDIVVPEGVTSVESIAFFKTRHQILSVTFPESVTKIGELGLAICSRLNRINVSPNNTKYCSIDGVLYSKDKKTLLSCTKNITHYSLHDGVTSIGEFAFKNCVNLLTVDISAGVTNIGICGFTNANNPFVGCEKLTDINVSENNTEYCSIDGVVFAKDKKTILFFPAGRTQYSIPDGVTSIGMKSFYNCENLTSIIIPEGVRSIGMYAFSGCVNLKSVTISESVTSIDDDGFCDCDNLTQVTVIGNITPVIRKAFKDCDVEFTSVLGSGKKYNTELEDLTIELKQKNELLDEKRAHVKKLLDKISALNMDVRIREGSVNVTTTAKDKLGREVNAAENKVKELEKTETELRDELIMLSGFSFGKKKKLKERIEYYERELATARGQLADITQKWTAMDISGELAALSEAKKNLAQLEAEAEAETDLVSELSSEVSWLQEKVEKQRAAESEYAEPSAYSIEPEQYQSTISDLSDDEEYDEEFAEENSAYDDIRDAEKKLRILLTNLKRV